MLTDKSSASKEKIIIIFILQYKFFPWLRAVHTKCKSQWLFVFKEIWLNIKTQTGREHIQKKSTSQGGRSKQLPYLIIPCACNVANRHTRMSRAGSGSMLYVFKV